MPIKNYTTVVPANRSIEEIQSALVRHGATGMMYEYDGEGKITVLRFRLPMEGKDVFFSLPVNWRNFQAVLKDQKVRRWDDDNYVYRVAWRNIRDWVLAQLALYETQIVELPQVFLPFATNGQGKTFYELAKGNNLLLGGGSDN
ncbi:MAG: hypothetical protein AB9866_18850 [Syntrophobacteraceae bacterium]